MLARLSEEMREIQRQIAACEQRAADPRTSKAARADFARLARSWRRLAESYDLAARISGFLEWQSQRCP